MQCKERGGWTQEGLEMVRQADTLHRAWLAGKPGVDPTIEYAQQVFKNGLADGVWCLVSDGEIKKFIDFVLVMDNPRHTEIHESDRIIQMLLTRFLVTPIRFEVKFSALSAKDMADLIEKGYGWVPGIANDASPECFPGSLV